MTGRRVRMLPWDPLWRLRHVGYPVSPRGYRGLPAFASLSMAGSECTRCIWGCRMPVELFIDPWNPAYRYRFETFCYGPRSYTFYKAGAPRKVPGRKGMTWVEEDGVDE